MSKGHYCTRQFTYIILKTPPLTSPAPMLNDGWQSVLREGAKHSPQNADCPLRPHSDGRPGEGEGEDNCNEAQKQHPAKLLLLGEAVQSTGEIASDGG